MNFQATPLSEITRQEATELFSKEMGIADMVRILSQVTMGYGNYT